MARYLALATDYDGTLAHDGVVNEETLEALRRFRKSGRKIILVTGRELSDLARVFSHFELFDRIVAENGALVFDPASGEKRLLAQAPPERFIEELKRRDVTALSVGDVIVATWHPHEAIVLESIRKLGLDLQVIFNKDAVMVLPAGINKLTGLRQALNDLKLSRHNVAGVGDAENDHAFLNCCGCSVAVANALPAVKERADLVTAGDHGKGVTELIQRILKDDLRSLRLSPEKHGILFGRSAERDLFLDAAGQTVLLCGLSGSGKSTFTAGLVERLVAREYQVCLVDPEGDYENLAGMLTLGSEERPPSLEEVFHLIENPSAQVTVNLNGIKMEDRPGFFRAMLKRMEERRMLTGRPHWIVVDEAHHLLPSDSSPKVVPAVDHGTGLLLITVHPKHVSPAALGLVNVLAVVGNAPREGAREFAEAIGVQPPHFPAQDLKPGEAAVWFRESGQVIERMRSVAGKSERQRHRRKYALGELEPERVFHFRGSEQKMDLRAHNLATFVQLATGVDDETWLYHLRHGDYSDWLASCIKDPELGDAVRLVEQDGALSAKESRDKIVKAIEAKYAAPI